MNENLFETQYDVTKKSKLKKFYEVNKILIFSVILILIIAIASVSFYSETKEKKKILLSDNYLAAKVYLENGDRNKVKNILKTIIFANNSTYSTLSLFLILNENLIVDQGELSNLFDHVLENNKFEKEVKNLIIFKKGLFNSDFETENNLISILNPLINSKSVWKSHALYLMAEYFYSKNQKQKAKEFYNQILTLENSNENIKLEVQKKLRRDFSE